MLPFSEDLQLDDWDLGGVLLHLVSYENKFLFGWKFRTTTID